MTDLGQISIQQLRFVDLYQMNDVNLDEFTENFELPFYGNYINKDPTQCLKAVDADGKIAGYIIGDRAPAHGHICALAVSPDYRRIGLGSALMCRYHEVMQEKGVGFVELFVRPSNTKAVKFYEDIGYKKDRVMKAYYQNNEDAYVMMKSLEPV